MYNKDHMYRAVLPHVGLEKSKKLDCATFLKQTLALKVTT